MIACVFGFVGFSHGQYLQAVAPADGEHVYFSQGAVFQWDSVGIDGFRVEFALREDFEESGWLLSIPRRGWTGRKWAEIGALEWDVLGRASRGEQRLFWRVVGSYGGGKVSSEPRVVWFDDAGVGPEAAFTSPVGGAAVSTPYEVEIDFAWGWDALGVEVPVNADFSSGAMVIVCDRPVGGNILAGGISAPVCRAGRNLAGLFEPIVDANGRAVGARMAVDEDRHPFQIGRNRLTLVNLEDAAGRGVAGPVSVEFTVEPTQSQIQRIRDAVSFDRLELGSVPAAIEIRDMPGGDVAFVVNGFSNNIQRLFLPTWNELDPIVLPEWSNPMAMAFGEDQRAYVANNIGQNVAIVNYETGAVEDFIYGSGDWAFDEPSSAAISNGKVYVANANLDEYYSAPEGSGFVSVIDMTTDGVIGIIPTTDRNPTAVKAIGPDRVYVTNTGNPHYDFSTGIFVYDTPSSIDIIDTDPFSPTCDMVIGNVPFGLNTEDATIGGAGKMAVGPNGRFAYLGSGTAGVAFKVDLLKEAALRDVRRPIQVVRSGALQDSVFDVEVGAKGLAYVASFNTDEVYVLNTNGDIVNPFPFVVPFDVGQSDGGFFEGAQDMAVRPGVPGVDYTGDDLFVITGISSRLVTVDTRSVLGDG